MSTIGRVSLRATIVISTLAGVALIRPTPASAQYLGGGTKTMAEAQVADLEDMRDKFIGLAEAIPADRYDWRPMEGVRSVRDVLQLIVAEGALFPTSWGYDRPDWSAEGGFGPELARLSALPGEELASELARGFEHVIGVVQGADAEARAREVNFFGLTVPLETAFTLMANDMHEHLGQLIAYARTNEIVPPWSRSEG